MCPLYGCPTGSPQTKTIAVDVWDNGISHGQTRLLDRCESYKQRQTISCQHGGQNVQIPNNQVWAFKSSFNKQRAFHAPPSYLGKVSIPASIARHVQRTCEPFGLSKLQQTAREPVYLLACQLIPATAHPGSYLAGKSYLDHLLHALHLSFFVVQRCAVWISLQRPILSKTRIHDQSRSIHAHSISFTKEPGVQCPACWAAWSVALQR